MGLMLEWFGIESIDKDIKKELKLIDELLDDVSDIDSVVNKIGVRKKKLRNLLAPNGRRIKNGFSLKKKVNDTLQPYLNGEKQTKNLTKILILHKMLSDFDHDHLWQELIQLWNEEYDLILKGNLDAVKNNLQEQKHIAETLKKVVVLEFNETHIHFGPNIDADIHWKYLKRLWTIAVKELKKPDVKAKITEIRNTPRKDVDTNSYASNIILLLEAYNRTYNRSYCGRENYQRIYDDDKKALHRIMRNYFSKKWTETKVFVEFEKLLIMQPEEYGTFRGFQRKAEILNMIQQAASSTNFRREYFIKNIENMVQHNLAHNITHIEIRYPVQQLEGFKFFTEIIQETEKKYPVTIRAIQFPVRTIEALIKFYEEYSKLPKRIRKYIVGVDFVGDIENTEALNLAEKSGIPLCVHAGELFKRNTESVEHALREVELALNFPTIHRIGHATILGIDIRKYLQSKVKPAKITSLVRKQSELISRVKKQDVFIEANPSSNVQIAGLKHYGEHPIAKFSEHGVKFAISTDDRVSFDTNLKKEFYRIARALRWTSEEIDKAARMQKEARLK
ncbi:hypothetical protein HQ545_04330 [Candidatus Woesearchaeota archaeon]|nr:hypothetical protein [Candidatus Woesearchaeota archaeon]